MKFLLTVLALLVCASCTEAKKPGIDTSAATTPAPLQCSKDTDCKGDRICEQGKCTAPSQSVNPLASPDGSSSAVIQSNANPRDTPPIKIDVCNGVGTGILDQLIGMSYRDAKSKLTGAGFTAAPLNEFVDITDQVQASRRAGLNEVIACNQQSCGYAFDVPGETSMSVYVSTTPQGDDPSLWKVHEWSHEEGWCRG